MFSVLFLWATASHRTWLAVSTLSAKLKLVTLASSFTICQLETIAKCCTVYLFAEHVRVVNGSNRCNGRVEVFHNNQWRRVCGSDWGKEEGDVLCREISCGGPAVQAATSDFGEARDVTGVKTNCFGNESSLSQCTLQEFKEACVDATVFCTSK